MPLKDPAKKQLRDRRNRQRHAERVAGGVCTRCGRLPPAPGLKVCGACAEKRRATDRARRARARQQGQAYAGRDPERCRQADRAGDRRRRRERRDAGLCTSCGHRRPEDDRSVCETCREARRALDRRRYTVRRAAGRCVRCTATHGRRTVTLRPVPRAGEGARLPRAGERRQQETIFWAARKRRMCGLQGACR